jgi:hypothetical protein
MIYWSHLILVRFNIVQLKECLNLNHTNLRSNRALRVEIKRRFTKFGGYNMFESIGAKLINKIDILNFYDNLQHVKLYFLLKSYLAY